MEVKVKVGKMVRTQMWDVRDDENICRGCRGSIGRVGVSNG